MEPIHLQVGRNLLAIRRARGLSLEQMAELTGVSKAMLGQIERGDSNPTISTLWKIVNGLHISFTSLIEEKTTAVSLVRINELTPFEEEQGAFRSFPLFPFDQRKKFEVYFVEIETGATHHSEPHNEGVEEYIFVVQGEIQVTVQNESYTIEPNTAMQFRADQPHQYYNSSLEKAMFYALIFYPS